MGVRAVAPSFAAMRTTSLRGIGLLLLPAVIGACGSSKNVADNSDPQPVADGQIKVEVQQAAPGYEVIQTFVEDSALFDDITDALNDELALPTDIVVNVGGDPQGPYFDPSTGMIEYPYEFMDVVYSMFADDYEGEELEATIAGALRFVYVHELGHALIEALDIPVLGKEEDAVDGLAAVVLTQVMPEHGVPAENGAYDAISAAELFFDFSGATGGEVNVEVEAFADEHSMDLQRFYSITCLVAGSNQETYTVIEQADFVPEDRLVRCPAEHEQALSGWARLLEPYAEKS